MSDSEIVYRARVLTGPQVGFPLPGEAEVNVVVELINLETLGDDTPSETIVAVVITKRLPPVGEEIDVIQSYDFYYEKRSGVVRQEASPRYFIKE